MSTNGLTLSLFIFTQDLRVFPFLIPLAHTYIPLFFVDKYYYLYVNINSLVNLIFTTVNFFPDFENCSLEATLESDRVL